MIEPSFEHCEKNKSKKCCIDIVIYILSIIFTFLLGVVIGAVTTIYEVLGLGAFVALLVILFILIIIRIIALICCKKC